MASSHIAGFLLDDVLAKATTFADTASAKLMGILLPVTATLLVIYILLWAAGMAAGQISEPFTDGMKRILRIAIILTIGFTAGIYSTNVVHFALNTPSALAQELQNAMPGVASSCAYTGHDTSALADTLDQFANAGFCVGINAYAQAGALNVGMYGVALIAFLTTALLIATAAGILFVTFIALAVLLAVGPLFIMLAIFRATQRFFELWLGHVVNFMLTFLLISCVVALSFSIIGSYVSALTTAPATDALMAALKLAGMTLAVGIVLFEAKHMAAAMGGGAALGTANMGGKLASVGAGMRNVSNPNWRKAVSTHMGNMGRTASAPVRVPVRGGAALARRVYHGSNSARGS